MLLGIENHINIVIQLNFDILPIPNGQTLFPFGCMTLLAGSQVVTPGAPWATLIRHL